MTLPVLGVIGLTFMCMLLVGGILLLILLTRPELRHRLCEALASYRGPPKEDKVSRSHRKKKHADDGFEDMYTSRVPPPIEMRPQSFHDTPQQYAYNQGYPPVNQQKAVRNPYVQQQPSQHHQQQFPHQQQHHHRTENPYVSHPQRIQQQQPYMQQPGYQARRHSSGEKVVGYTSSGTNSPPDSAIGTMEGKGIHGILKHNDNGKGKGDKGQNKGARSLKTKSVGYEDEIHTIEIS